MPAIIFICTANICRSPLATALFREKVRQSDESWRVESAGTWAYEGERAVENVFQVLESRGLDISDHRSRLATHDLLASFDLILTMEQGHMEALKAEYPDLAGRIYMLSEVTSQNLDIKDPMGGPLYEFEETAKEFERIFDQGFENILRLAKNAPQSKIE